jgi:hypothetical protein
MGLPVMLIIKNKKCSGLIAALLLQNFHCSTITANLLRKNYAVTRTQRKGVFYE